MRQQEGDSMFKVMFLCTGNTCRSQMAEGLAKELGKDILIPFSAGVNPTGMVHPGAIAAMKELGIDISNQTSKGIDMELLKTMDIIITLCGNAEASCPTTPPEITKYHWGIDDPVVAVGTEEKIATESRKARDEIKDRIQTLIQSLRKQEKQ